MGLPGTVPSDAPQLAQSLREGVAALPFFLLVLVVQGDNIDLFILQIG